MEKVTIAFRDAAVKQLKGMNPFAPVPPVDNAAGGDGGGGGGAAAAAAAAATPSLFTAAPADVNEFGALYSQVRALFPDYLPLLHVRLVAMDTAAFGANGAQLFSAAATTRTPAAAAAAAAAAADERSGMAASAKQAAVIAAANDVIRAINATELAAYWGVRVRPTTCVLGRTCSASCWSSLHLHTSPTRCSMRRRRRCRPAQRRRTRA